MPWVTCKRIIRALCLVATWLIRQILLTLRLLKFKCSIVSTKNQHVTFVKLSSPFWLPDPRVYLFITPEAPRVHHYSPDYLPETGNRDVEADDMSPVFEIIKIKLYFSKTFFYRFRSCRACFWSRSRTLSLKICKYQSWSWSRKIHRVSVSLSMLVVSTTSLLKTGPIVTIN